MSDNPASTPITSSEKTQSLFEEIFDTVREPLLVLDKNLCVQKASTAFYNHFRVTPDVTQGRLVYELGNGQWNTPELRKLLEKVLPDNAVFNNYEVRHTFEDLGSRIILLNARRIDHLQLILLAMEDVTEKNQALEQLREDEERFRLLVEAASQAVWEAGPQGLNVKDSPSWRAYTGQSRREMQGMGWLNAVHPEDQEVAGRKWREAVDTKSKFDAEFRLRGPDGDWRWTHVRAVPIRNPRGETLKWVGMNLDVTDRKKAEFKIREDQVFYRQVLESIPGMLFTTRADGYCDWQSKQWADYTGVPVDKHLGSGWNKLLHPDDRERAYHAWREAVKELAPYDLEYRVRRKDGQYEWFKVCGRPIRNANGEIVRWFGTALNINQLVRTQDELKNAKDKAEAAAQAKGEFLANMSHEIRTPMTIFLGALEHLEQVDRNPEHQRLLQMADRSARHLRELIDDILDFSRIEAGHVEIHPGPLELRAWVEDVIGMFRPLAREKNLRLTSRVADEVPAIIEADATRLKQILTNLVGNAIKFTPQGEVKVMVKTSGDHLEFVVSDTGIGIPEEKQHLLFQSFSQVDSSFQRNYGGTGLGLAISKKLAELMGGRISVRSRVGEGSRFTLALPLKVPIRQEGESSARSDVSPGNEPSVRILLAEDNPMIRELFIMGLERRGWHVEVARSGEEALGMWILRPFDIILMDLQMSGMDGLEATRQIRAKESGGEERVCIIGVTAHARRKIIEECLKEGMDEVLTKPLKPKELEETILRYLGKEQA